jgi:hypothetical protein
VTSRAPFELEWLGGVSEKHFRKVRPGIEEMPWGTLETADLPQLLVDRARVSWTEAAYNEYCTAAAFADLIGALLKTNAPVDLVGMASDFVADEVLHVELTSRIAMELGGGAPYEIDFTNLTLPETEGLTPFERANELVVRVCCVGEAFSVPMLAGCFRHANHPLTKRVLERIVQDEAPHGRFGFLYLGWAEPKMSPGEKDRLATVALETLELFAPHWTRLQSKTVDGVTSEGFRLEHIQRLGWNEAEAYARAARKAVRQEILAPLSKFGIDLDRTRTEALLAAGPLGHD